jgi:hypothetical protein
MASNQLADPKERRKRPFVIAAVVGLVFGAADQYIGSLKPMVALGPWTISLSQMSALWLLLPFVFGATQDGARRAVAIGSVATIAGLLGYFTMTVSPLEVELSQALGAIPGLLASNMRVIVGGLVTGPLFGWLGWRWRMRHSWIWAAPVAAAFLFEPVARIVTREMFGPKWVWWTEVAVGCALLTAALVEASARRARESR